MCQSEVIPRFSGNFTCLRCEQNIVEAVEQEEKLCDEVETVSEFTYLGDRVSAIGGCEAGVTVRTRYGWVKFREYGELLYGWKGLFIRVAYGQQYCMEVKHGAWMKVRWEFYVGQ